MLRLVRGGLVYGFGSLVYATSAQAETRTVGPDKLYATPCAAFAAAADGDTIAIDARGSYVGDVCAIRKNNLTIRGAGGRAHIDAGGQNADGKAIWVIQGSDTVVEDIELSGCSVPDKNGAGIRQEGRNLTVRRCYFHDNQNGFLGDADPESVYLFEDSEFARNGAGDGQSHNMYIGEIKSFTLSGCYSHDANVGHLVKSRALHNQILYSRLTDEAGTASYQVDLPQGGVSVLIGNLLQKSPAASNSSFVSFARESKRNADSALWVVGNTFFNARSAGTFVAVASDIRAVTLRDNVFAGPGTVCDLASAVREANFVGDPQFVDAAGFDFQLRAGSPAVDQGIPAGTGAGESLTPVCQYAHPAHAVVRMAVGALDLGAFELGGESRTPCGGSAPSPDLDAGLPNSSDDAGARGPANVDAAVAEPRADAGSRIEPHADGSSSAEPDANITEYPDDEPMRRISGSCQVTPAARGSLWTVLASLSWLFGWLRRRTRR